MTPYAPQNITCRQNVKSLVMHNKENEKETDKQNKG